MDQLLNQIWWITETQLLRKVNEDGLLKYNKELLNYWTAKDTCVLLLNYWRNW
jgi:hypothetical protein